MATTVTDLKNWYRDGMKQKARYMIVVCDTFDHDDYPVYVARDEDFWKVHAEYNGKNMQRVMEVYDMSIPFSYQSTGRVNNVPERT